MQYKIQKESDDGGFVYNIYRNTTGAIGDISDGVLVATYDTLQTANAALYDLLGASGPKDSSYYESSRRRVARKTRRSKRFGGGKRSLKKKSKSRYGKSKSPRRYGKSKSRARKSKH